MENNKHTRIITFTSGKGGVGKTNISVGTAMALAREGYRVCLFDADLGLANINIILGLNPEYNLEDLISGRKSLDEIIIKDFNGIDIIPGSSGLESIANLNESELKQLIDTLCALKEYDFIIFDTSAGIAASVIAFCMAASEVLLVIMPEPTSLTDAYALLKVLLVNGFEGKVSIIVNQSWDAEQAKKIYKKFSEAVITHLKFKLSLAGVVMSDPKLTESVKEQRPFLILHPESRASICVGQLAKTLLSISSEEEFGRDLTPFWERCFKIIKNPLSIKGIAKKKADKDLGDKNENVSVGQSKREVNPLPVEASGDKGDRLSSITPDKSIREDDGEDACTESAGSADNETPELLKELISSIVTVSDELRKIREEMGKQQQIKVKKAADTEKMIDLVRNNNMFVLDYEAFLKKNNMQ